MARSTLEARQVADPNLEISGLLHDLAHIYRDGPKRMAYRRAASMIAGMDRPITELVHDGRLEKLPRVGPAIERIILEYLDRGTSAIVERAFQMASKDRQRAVLKRRGVRDHFLSVARARQILLEHRRAVVGLGDYRGDLQQHSVWSDGSESLEEIIEQSIALGQEYGAITDHYGLPIARGLTAEQFARQHEEIDALNARYAGTFRLLKGVEANILADGSLDAPADTLERDARLAGIPPDRVVNCWPLERLLDWAAERSMARLYSARVGGAANGLPLRVPGYASRRTSLRPFGFRPSTALGAP